MACTGMSDPVAHTQPPASPYGLYSARGGLLAKWYLGGASGGSS
jgi:hypothetical protein